MFSFFMFMKQTGLFSGLVGALQNGKADICMTSLKISPERNKVIDFSIPFLETGITIVVAVREGVISPTAFLGKFVAVSLDCCMVYKRYTYVAIAL